MTGLLLWKEHLKEFYNKYSYPVQLISHFLFALCTFVSLDVNIGYMTKLSNPAVVVLASLVCAPLPCGVAVFLGAAMMLAHIYAVSLEMTLIALALILVLAILYFSFRTGDSYLMVLTPLAFLFHVPYAVPLLVGLGGGLASVIPVSCGVFLYYLVMYVKQNAGVLTGEISVDMVQRYSQIVKSVVFNETMVLMMITCAVGITVVYLIRRLSIDYAWQAATVAGCVAQLLVIFVGDFVFDVPAQAGAIILGMALSVLIALVFTFFFFSVDYTRTEYVQFEDDDYYYYVKAVPKMAVSTPDVQVKRINTRRRSKERGVREPSRAESR